MGVSRVWMGTLQREGRDDALYLLLAWRLARDWVDVRQRSVYIIFALVSTVFGNRRDVSLASGGCRIGRFSRPI